MWLIGGPAAKDGSARVGIAVFIGPLQDVADQIENAERTCTSRKIGDACGRTHVGSRIDRWKYLCIPGIAPGIGSAVGGLRGILPLPLMRKSLASPCRIGASILDRDPRYRLIVP